MIRVGFLSCQESAQRKTWEASLGTRELQHLDTTLQEYRTSEKAYIFYTQYCISFHLIHTLEEVIKVKR